MTRTLSLVTRSLSKAKHGKPQPQPSVAKGQQLGGGGVGQAMDAVKAWGEDGRELSQFQTDQFGAQQWTESTWWFQAIPVAFS